MAKWLQWFKTKEGPKYGVEFSPKSTPLISSEMRAQAEIDRKAAENRPVSIELSLPEATLVMNLLLRYVNASDNIGLQHEISTFSAPKRDFITLANRHLKSDAGSTAMALLQTYHAINYVDQVQAEVGKLDARISDNARNSLISEFNKGESGMAFNLRLGERITQLAQGYQTEETQKEGITLAR